MIITFSRPSSRSAKHKWLETCPGVATARQVQLSLEYDPQPPLGGIDYAHKDSLVPLPMRLVIGTMGLAAPLLTAGPRRMTRKAGWKPLV